MFPEKCIAERANSRSRLIFRLKFMGLGDIHLVISCKLSSYFKFVFLKARLLCSKVYYLSLTNSVTIFYEHVCSILFVSICECKGKGSGNVCHVYPGFQDTHDVPYNYKRVHSPWKSGCTLKTQPDPKQAYYYIGRKHVNKPLTENHFFLGKLSETRELNC